MAHTLLLAFKDSPTAGDDYVDLGQVTGSGAAATGFGLTGFSIGDPTTDEVGRQVRALAITGEVQGTSNDTAIALLRKIDRFILQTRRYFKRLGGNSPNRTDLAHHTGLAAVLTFKPQGATNTVYWNILDGEVKLIAPDMLGPDILNNNFQVSVTLVVEAVARGARVYLCNLVAGGDFTPPFAIDNTNFPDLDFGWAFTGTWSVANSNGVHSAYSITTSTGGGTATSNENTFLFDPVTGTTAVPLIPQVWLKTTVTSGTVTVKLQSYNGAAWSDQQTLASVSTTTNLTKYTGSTFTPTYGTHTKVRLLITNATTGTVWVASPAIWKNPTGGTAPVEYLSGTANQMTLNQTVYNVQGDVPAPCKLRVGDTLFLTYRALIAGAMPYNPTVDKPIYAFDYWTGALAEAVNTSVFFNHLPATTSNAGTLSPFNLYSGTNRTIDYRPRRYRALLYYAANDASSVTQVTVKLQMETKSYTVTLPQTYTGTANASAADFRLYDLGDYSFGRPGTTWEESTVTMVGGTYTSQLSLTHPASGTRRLAVGGLVLIPAEKFAVLDLPGSSANGVTLEISSEGAAPRASIPEPGTANNSYREPSSFVSGATLTGGDFLLDPNYGSADPTGAAGTPYYTGTRFEMVVLSARNSSDTRQMTPNSGTNASFFTLSYTPRYLHGLE